MKIIIKNSTMDFKVFEPKRVWNDTELRGTGSIATSQLRSTDGNVYTNSSLVTTVSPLISLIGATSIVCHAIDSLYVSRISFFNSASSGTTAVYHETTSTPNSGVNIDFTIDSTIINAAIAAGADSFRIHFYTEETNASVNVQTT